MTDSTVPPGVEAPRRILIVDDHPLICEGLSEVIRQEPDLMVCGQTDNAFAALRLAASLQPDLAIVDILIHGKHGLELVKDLHAQNPHLAILVFSMHHEIIYAERSIRAGALGYLTKEESPERLLAAIRQVLAGEIAVSDAIAMNLVDHWVRKSPARSVVEHLSDRELEIFHLTGLGKGNQEIANFLHISAKTVVAHRTQIKVKLKLSTVAELVATAARWAEDDTALSAGAPPPALEPQLHP